MCDDPVAHAVAAAPPDDEPVTEEDSRCYRDGQAWFRQRGGRGIPMEDALAEFGLKAEEQDRMSLAVGRASWPAFRPSKKAGQEAHRR